MPVKKSKRTAKKKSKPQQRAAPKRAVAAAKRKRKPAKAKAKSPAKRAKARPVKRTGDDSKWPSFVEKHGVVLASARGPVPSLAEAIAGEPIIGSWWSHPKAQAIFDALSSVDDCDDIRCFKLVDKKITFVHRKAWPALVKLASSGVLSADRVESIQQEHMPTGEHRNFTTPFPDWVPEDVSAQAERLGVDEARKQLGAWI